ncbi:NAD(P)-binding protein [Lentinula edodes]|uniref:NAD(P)-binding protein n=1 Tax=Lentinula edodes TaxID=5353 RepID=UPI001E8E48C5|nr:NAD(P)-binding protein [Lentinula edodes]KAH7877569.1 NAD(P)-binding protein [Lentinula edodes]
MPVSKLPPPARVGSFSEKWPPKPTWKAPEDVPDLSGQIFLVTGGNVGIGRETCRILVARNAKVYLAARSEERAQTAIDDICRSTGKSNIHFLKIDLSDLSSVRKAAEQYISMEQELHVLINNAFPIDISLQWFLYSPGIGPQTAQGYDVQFGVHVLGHYFFTLLLMPTLLRTANGEISGTPKPVRVVSVSSDAHEMTAPKKGIGVVLISSELARRYGDQGVVAISLHPGGVKSELLRHLHPIIAWIVEKIRIYPVSLGIITTLYAATSEAALHMNGEYLTAWARRQVPSIHAQNLEMGERLWNWCEEQVSDF